MTRANPLSKWWSAPVAPEGLAVFRILFGAVMVAAVVRFAARGWIGELLVEPRFHFTYLGFDWVRPWPGWGMHVHFALMGMAALGVMVGYGTRWSAAAFFVLFTHAELIEAASYLNHYYFVSIVALLCAVLPVGAAWSLDARRVGRQPVGAWSYAVLRAQLALVYVFAGLAKLNGDWLWRGEPLRTWLAAHADAPVVGGLLALPATALLLSWGGALFDLTIPFWLAWRRTRRWAYAAAVVFHTSVWLLFPIGVFSWVMLAAATVFFDPDWPRRLLRRPDTPEVHSSLAPARWVGALLVLHLGLQIVIPLRFLAYPGAVNWTEEGFRFAWRVMLVEKTGEVELLVESDALEQPVTIYPRRELTPLQYKMMSTEPDMIHQYALAVAERYGGRARVHARAYASLNGRPSQPLIDERIDLAAEPRSLAPKRWIVPLAR